MPDPWDRFDRLVRASGRVRREARLLTDTELLALLGTPCDPDREHLRHVLEREALARLGGERDAGRIVAELSSDPRPPGTPEKRHLKDVLMRTFQEHDPPHRHTGDEAFSPGTSLER